MNEQRVPKRKEHFHSPAEWNAYLEGLQDGKLAAPAEEELCVTAPSATSPAVAPVTGSIGDIGTKNADTYKTVIVGLPIIRKLLNGQDVELETLRVNLIPDDVLWNAYQRAAEPAGEFEKGRLQGREEILRIVDETFGSKELIEKIRRFASMD